METDLKTFPYICYSMVNNIGVFLEKTGIKDLPYQLSGLSNTTDIDNIVLTSENDNDLFKKFEEQVHSKYSENTLIGIYADPNYREQIEKSDKIHENAVTFFTYENGSPSTQMAQLLSESINEKSLILSSKDYLQEIRNDIEMKLKDHKDEFIGVYN